MQPKIQPWDWERMLFGTATPVFLVEILLRTIIVFVCVVVAMRLLGKRMNGQLTIAEMAIMLTMGAIAGAGMQISDRGLLQALVVLLFALVFHRTLTWLEYRSPKFETVSQGTTDLLVRDGVLQLKALKAAGLSRDRVFAHLRGEKIFNLGRTRRLYLEACGVFSVVEFSEDRPGLSLIPSIDRADEERKQADGALQVCRHCGLVRPNASVAVACTNCGSNNWDKAITISDGR